MPELPEIEATKQGLDGTLNGKTISRVEAGPLDLRRPLPVGFKQRAADQKILRLRRRSKHLLLDLSSDETVIVHFGMTGSLRVKGITRPLPLMGREPDPIHDHFTAHFTDGTSLAYNDVRRFGFIDLWPTNSLDQYAAFQDLGPEPLSNAFNGRSLFLSLQKKSGPVKPALLDQSVIAGLGNIYASEALFEAGISPRRKSATLGPKRCERLAGAIRNVVLRAIDQGVAAAMTGADTSNGYYDAVRFRVYGRDGQACQRCGSQIRQFRQSGRSTYSCGGCQR